MKLIPKEKIYDFHRRKFNKKLLIDTWIKQTWRLLGEINNPPSNSKLK